MFKMLNQNTMFYIIVIFVLVVCIKVYLESETYNLKCIVSTVDGHKYCVREREKMKPAANLLAEVTQKCKELVKYVGKKYPDDEACQRLVNGFNPKKITETLPTSELTAYSENKGEKIAFCLNKKKDGTKLIDINTLTFVAIHELSHIMTKSVGHKQEFWQNFKFLLENAKAANIYVPIDYKKEPEEYCGMTITDNPYYDM
jgi:hypothetical protein